jgi:hypothetical protein
MQNTLSFTYVNESLSGNEATEVLPYLPVHYTLKCSTCLREFPTVSDWSPNFVFCAGCGCPICTAPDCKGRFFRMRRGSRVCPNCRDHWKTTCEVPERVKKHEELYFNINYIQPVKKRKRTVVYSKPELVKYSF